MNGYIKRESKVSERVRCFIAVDVEESDIVGKITKIQEELEGTGTRLKTVEPENLHITLRFIGEIPKPVVEAIKEKLSTLEFKSFTINFSGVGAFPRVEKPRVIWVGVDKGRDELSELSNRVNKLLSSLKIPKENKEFVPHLTIARVKSYPSPKLPKVIMRLKDVAIGSMKVDNVKLKKSTLTSKGPIYDTLFRVEAKD